MPDITFLRQTAEMIASWIKRDARLLAEIKELRAKIDELQQINEQMEFRVAVDEIQLSEYHNKITELQKVPIPWRVSKN